MINNEASRLKQQDPKKLINKKDRLSETKLTKQQHQQSCCQMAQVGGINV